MRDILSQHFARSRFMEKENDVQDYGWQLWSMRNADSMTGRQCAARYDTQLLSLSA